METEFVDSHFHLNRAHEAIQLGRFLLEDTEDADTLSKPNRQIQAEIQFIKHGGQHTSHWPRNRSVRVEKLRDQVEAGTYQINITVLAESILKNEDHLLQCDCGNRSRSGGCWCARSWH